MSSLKVTVLKCDRCSVEGDPSPEWTTVSMHFPREKGSNRRRRTLHVCPECTPALDHWLHEREPAPETDDNADLEAWLHGDAKERKPA